MQIFDGLHFIRRIANTNVTDIKGNTPLFLAVSSGDTEKVTALLLSRASIHITNADGDTSFTSAVFCGNLFIISILLLAEADPNMRNRGEDTALRPEQDVKRLRWGWRTVTLPPPSV